MEPPTNHILEAKEKFLELSKNLQSEKLKYEDLIFKKEEDVVQQRALKQVNENRL